MSESKSCKCRTLQFILSSPKEWYGREWLDKLVPGLNCNPCIGQEISVWNGNLA